MLLGCALSGAPAGAQSTTWISPGGGDWFGTSNWSNGLPTTSTDASINNGVKVLIDGRWATARKLTLGAATGDHGPLFVDGTAGASGGALAVGPCLNCNTAEDGDGTITEGSLYVGREGSGELTITNGGLVDSKGYAYIAPEVGSSGTVTVDGAGSTWQVGSTQLNAYYGKLLVGADTGVPGGGTATLSMTNGGSVIVTNRFAASIGVTVGTSGNGILTINNSVGGYATRLISVFGTLAPSGGTMQLNGSLQLNSDALTLVNVTPQVVDRVDVLGTGTTGGAKLNGRLIVVVNGTFTPGPNCGLRFNLLHADGGRTETFNSVSFINTGTQKFTAQIKYDANNVYLDLTFRNCQ